jgi:hypothetical protein
MDLFWKNHSLNGLDLWIIVHSIQGGRGRCREEREIGHQSCDQFLKSAVQLILLLHRLHTTARVAGTTGLWRIYDTA